MESSKKGEEISAWNKKGETSLARLISPLVGLTPNLSQNNDSCFSAFVQRFQPIAQIQTKLI